MLSYKANRKHLPKEMKIFLGQEEKTIELEWCPILKGKVIEKIMVTVRDVTQFRKLQAESDQKSHELKMIEQLIQLDHGKFNQVYDQTKNLMDECVELCSRKNIDEALLKVLFPETFILPKGQLELIN